MNLELIREILLWSTVINYGLLIWWALFFIFGHDWIYRLHGRWFCLTIEQFDAIHYAGMAFYKIGIFLFNLIPLIALYIVT